MQNDRFEKFTLLIDGIHKIINKMKVTALPLLEIKSVHIFWIYELLYHPDGLTSAELASVSMVDRSLVSREIVALRKNGVINSEKTTGKRNYNGRHTLTEKGQKLAEHILTLVREVQKEADSGISREELDSFYSTLEKLHRNFSRIDLQSNGVFKLTD